MEFYWKYLIGSISLFKHRRAIDKPMVADGSYSIGAFRFTHTCMACRTRPLVNLRFLLASYSPKLTKVKISDFGGRH